MVEMARPRGAAQLAVRAAISLAALVALLYWMLWSAYLLVIRCGDTCSGEPLESGRWEYTGQFVLAAPSAVAAVLGLVLGFTRLQRASRLLLVLAASGAFTWFLWVYVVGRF